jgi:hypothetical protein
MGFGSQSWIENVPSYTTPRVGVGVISTVTMAEFPDIEVGGSIIRSGVL